MAIQLSLNRNRRTRFAAAGIAAVAFLTGACGGATKAQSQAGQIADGPSAQCKSVVRTTSIKLLEMVRTGQIVKNDYGFLDMGPFLRTIQGQYGQKSPQFVGVERLFRTHVVHASGADRFSSLIQEDAVAECDSLDPPIITTTTISKATTRLTTGIITEIEKAIQHAHPGVKLGRIGSCFDEHLFTAVDSPGSWQETGDFLGALNRGKPFDCTFFVGDGWNQSGTVTVTQQDGKRSYSVSPIKTADPSQPGD